MENYDVIIVYTKQGLNVEYNKTQDHFMKGVDNADYMRYLKGIFTNKARFQNRFCNPYLGVVNEMTELQNDGELDEFEYVDLNDWPMGPQVENWLELYDQVEPFSYEEAFKIEDERFRQLVFTAIDVVEMVNSLGYERTLTEGKKVLHKEFNAEGDFIGMKEYDIIYEILKVDGSKLTENIENRWGGEPESTDMYALRCWCTTTEEEHILWVEEEYKDSPLEAVASTCRMPENWIPHIKEIKRQGDIFLTEFHDDAPDDIIDNPSSNKVALNAEQYFGLLTAQS